MTMFSTTVPARQDVLVPETLLKVSNQSSPSPPPALAVAPRRARPPPSAQSLPLLDQQSQAHSPRSPFGFVEHDG